MALRNERLRDMPTRFDSGQVFSDVASDDGRNGAQYIPGSRSSSFKAQHLASEIATIESRCDHLEQRNKWLTEKLLKNQRSFIERTMMGNASTLARHVFKAWGEAMELLRYEKQLQRQTEDARACQQVAKELGAALAREQEVSRKNQEMRQQLEAQFDEVVDQNVMLKQNAEKQTAQIAALQRQISSVMDCLNRNKSEAESIVDSVDQLQKNLRDIKKEGDLPAQVSNLGPTAARQISGDAIQESVKLRDETKSLMASMSGLLNPPQSPDRDRRQPNYQASGGYSQGRSAEGRVPSPVNNRTEPRTTSPMDGRFQTVNSIVAELEQAPSLTSGADMLRAGGLSNLGQAGGARATSSLVERSPIFGRQSALGGAGGRR